MAAFIATATAGDGVAPVELARIGITGGDGWISSRATPPGSSGGGGSRGKAGGRESGSFGFGLTMAGGGSIGTLVVNRAVDLPAAAQCPVRSYQALGNLTTCLSLQVHLLDEAELEEREAIEIEQPRAGSPSRRG